MSSIHFESKLDADQIFKTLDKVERELGTMGDAVVREADKMDNAFRKMGGLLATYLSFEGGKQLVSELINVRGEFQQLDIAFQTILKNKGEADKLMAEVVEFAAVTPFELSEVAQGTKKLLAFNVEAGDTIETLRRLGDISSGLGTDLEGLIQAYGKVKAKGKLQAEEMNLFLERGIPLVSELAEKYGVAESAVYDMASKSMIHFEDLQEVIVNMTDEGGMFANMMEKQAASLPGQVSNLKDAIAQMLNEIGESNEGILYGGIGAAKTLVENYEKVLVTLKALIAGYGAYKAATIVSGIMQQAEALIGMTKALKAAVVARKALNLAQMATPIGAALGVIAATTTAIIGLTRVKREAAKAEKESTEAIGAEEAQMNALFSIIQKSNPGTKERAAAIELLNQKYEDYLPMLISEKTTVQELTTLQDEANESLLRSIAIKAQQEQVTAATKKRLEAENTAKTSIQSSVASSASSDMARVAVTAWQEIYDELTRYISADTPDELLRYFTPPKEVIDFAQQYGLAIDDVTTHTHQAVLAYHEYQKEIAGIDNIFTSLKSKVSGSPTRRFDAKEFSAEIKAAKTAYKEWEDFKNTTRADDLQSEYKKYLDLGATYEEYLASKLAAYKENADASAIVNKELAALEVVDIKIMDKFWEEVGKDNEKGAEKASDALEDWMDDWIDATEERLQKEIEAEEKSDSEKIQQAEDTAKAIQEIRERYAYESAYESRKAEYKKQLAALEDYYNEGLILHEEYEEIKAKVTRQYLVDEIDAFQRGMGKVSAAIVGLFQEIDKEAAESLNNVAELVDNALGAVKSYYSKDIAGFIAGIVGVASEIYQLIDDYRNKGELEALESQKRAYEAINTELDLANVLLEERIKLLDIINGTDWFLYLNTSLEDAQKQIDTTIGLMTTLAAGAFGRGDLPDGYSETKTGIDTSGWGMDEYRQLILDSTDFTKEQKEQMQGYIDKVIAYQNIQAQLIEDLNYKLTGTTSSAITDSIIEGLKNGELYFGDFADSFEDHMKQAIANSFQTKYLEKQMDEWYDLFLSLSEDGLSNPDVEALRAAYAEAINEASTIWDTMTGSYGDLFSTDLAADDSNSLSGSIRRELTEETGTLLAGRMNSIMLDVREGLDIRKDMQTSLNGIEYNTILMVDHLQNIRYGISTLNDRLS